METAKEKYSVTTIFKSFYPDILAYSASLLKNSDDAKDAVQEVFIRFMAHQNKFKEDCSIKTWLLIITRNYCYTRLKEKGRNGVVVDDNFRQTGTNNIEIRLILEEAVSKLKTEEYELLYLKEFAGYTYNEISEIMNISVNNAKIRLFRIRQQLKEFLK